MCYSIHRGRACSSHRAWFVLDNLELPLNQTGKVEKAIKDGSLNMEVDKIHGLDPILHRGKKDVI